MVLEDERNTISSTLKTTIPTDPALHAVGLSLLSLDLLLGNQRSIFVLTLNTNQWSSTREIGSDGEAGQKEGCVDRFSRMGNAARQPLTLLLSVPALAAIPSQIDVETSSG